MATIRAKPVEKFTEKKPTHYAFNYDNPAIDNSAEDEPKKAEKKEVEVEAEPGQYLVAQSTVDALSVEFLDEINQAFEEDPQADVLWTLIRAMQQLDPEQNAKSKPAMSGPSKLSDYKMNDEAIKGLGQEFMESLEVSIRLNPKTDPRKLINNTVEYIPSVKNMKK